MGGRKQVKTVLIAVAAFLAGAAVLRTVQEVHYRYEHELNEKVTKLNEKITRPNRLSKEGHLVPPDFLEALAKQFGGMIDDQPDAEE